VSFWLPGTYGSLAAVPAQPGWSFATIYYHTSVDAGAGTSFVRGGGVEAGIKADADLQMFGRLKDFRGVATRYDKLARNFLATALLAALVIWLA
jgi:transposase